VTALPLHFWRRGWQCADVAGAAEERGNRVRNLRLALGFSQREFAARLGVSLESYRPWDSGRRQTPDEIVRRALTVASDGEADLPMPLSALAGLLRINEGTLRAAARDGRLHVTTEAAIVPGKPILRATLADGEAFKTRYYGRTTRLTERPPAPAFFVRVPDDFDRQLVALRGRLRITQTDLADRVGAAGRAVIYQWESRRRRPSAIFWWRVLELCAGDVRS